MRACLTVCLCALAWTVSALPRVRAAEDILQRSRAVYAGLRSYSDTGVVLKEYGNTDTHTFSTLFTRTPRGFLFDFRKAGGDRYVIWGNPDAFHRWWKTTGTQEDFPNPSNVGVFITADFPTSGSAVKIPTLLYPNASLTGALTHFDDPEADGFEAISGHRCYRLIGTTRDVYTATGKEVNVRRLTVWIDAESLLIRRIVEEPKTRPGTINRTTTTFEPVANPAIDASRFKFEPPQ